MPGGFVAPEKVAVLAMLRQAGVDLPDTARIWGRSDGWAWRAVDHTGVELGVRSTVGLRELAAAGLVLDTQPDGLVIVHAACP